MRAFYQPTPPSPPAETDDRRALTATKFNTPPLPPHRQSWGGRGHRVATRGATWYGNSRGSGSVPAPYRRRGGYARPPLHTRSRQSSAATRVTCCTRSMQQAVDVTRQLTKCFFC